MKISIFFNLCIVFLVAVDKSLEEDDISECDSGSECLPAEDCQYVQEQQNLFQTLTEPELGALSLPRPWLMWKVAEVAFSGHARTRGATQSPLPQTTNSNSLCPHFCF